MTDNERRDDIDRSLQQWMRAMIARHGEKHTGLVIERLTSATGTEQTTSERLHSAIGEASDGG